MNININLDQGRTTYGLRARPYTRRDFDWPADCFWSYMIMSPAVRIQLKLDLEFTIKFLSWILPRNVKLTARVAHITKIECLSTFSQKSARKQHVCCAVKVLKEYNISHHYATKHAGYGRTLSAAERQTGATELDRKR
ncbi:hypothetical protein CHS0354_007284, partial [Potamilus streckersoni]